MKSRKGTLFDSKQYTREYIDENNSKIVLRIELKDSLFKPTKILIYSPGEMLETIDNEQFIRIQESCECHLMDCGFIEEDDFGDYVWAID
tara:strand:+ start:460 stop:729 length:270 start_codon:yes stop_codon:yes gene_type:complete